MSTEVIDAVNNLTEQTTELLGEFQDAKVNIDKKVELATTAQQNATTKAGEAATSAGAAAVSATEANTAKAGAKSEADRAELAASQATQVSGLETVEQAVTQALADGGYTWRTEADMQHERAINNAMFAASGFVHFGKHYRIAAMDNIINEGMWAHTSPGRAELLHLGRRSTDGVGRSKTDAPYVNIAGFVTELNVNAFRSGDSDYDALSIKFPEAEGGTRVYDSATGVSIDYAKEIDPKYGDIAPDHNEAVARAFEGKVKNGDFRFGDNGEWSLSGSSTAKTFVIADGIATLDAGGENSAVLRQAISSRLATGKTYKASCYVHSVNGTCSFSVTNHGGTQLKVGYNEFTFTKSTNADFVQFFFQYTGSVEVSNVSVSESEVVIDRVDMFGFEGFLEQITPTNPFVYKHGLIQSKANDIDGIAVTSSNRPDSYYAVYDGDTTSRGNGVNFLTLSVIEQDQIANNPKNHIYRMANGDIVQWRIRQRTFAGNGNGDWTSIDSTKTVVYAGVLQWGSPAWRNTIQPHGQYDELAAYSGERRFVNTASTIKDAPEKAFNGLFTVRQAYNYAYDNECYFLVCGTVSRLNQGAYHPNLNPLGTGHVAGSSDGETITGSSTWHSPAASKLTAKTYCFIQGDNGKPFTGVNDGSRLSGYIGNVSGRPDGRFYDAIYASGQGGVCDYRLSAWDKSSKEDAAEIIQKVNNGQYRGREKLKKMIPCTVSDFGWSYEQILKEDGTTLTLSDIDPSHHALITTSYGTLTARDIGIACPDPAMKIAKSGSIIVVPGTTYNGVKLLCPTYTNITVEGEFTQTDVIGDPANILQVDALKDGWLGSWLGVAEGNQDKFLTRKSMTSISLQNQPRTDDLGATWYTTGIAQDNLQNLVRWTLDANTVAIVNYTAFAKQTKPRANIAVLHGVDGVGTVHMANSSHIEYGCLLGESLFGNIGTGTFGWGRINQLPLDRVLIDKNGLLANTSANTQTSHGEVQLDSNNPAYKTLMPQINKEGQASLSFIANEIIHDDVADSWGDDGRMKVIAASTFTDLNGNVCKTDIHELAVPYGWVKNEI